MNRFVMRLQISTVASVLIQELNTMCVSLNFFDDPAQYL
jgi:hypothetical protein